ncbi:hypothetical protein OCK02_01690 [Rhizobium sp. TRM96647]|uniref:hypothetical protein n=1 Tax=unclassified Rhizobium TaxID=2613769 RepID=UPI0021E74B2F|nr:MULTISPECIES: hypothetical protein [unclassified Rhizobium]MCV3734901.1 hypothetical protein [Rhizobium sp. TRM96647]MCV3757271.1 hypothetical protein [Rhizobium sp. TRM96650]
MTSDDGHGNGDISEETIARFLEGGNGEVLTDMLVSALREAHRFLGEQMPAETRH